MSRLQLNLIPDIKLDYIKQQRTRNFLVSGAVLVSAVCLLALVIMMATVYGVQKKQLSNSDQTIAEATDQLQKIPNFSKILTVQNQLNALVGLHHNKHVNSRVFGYLPKITPTSVNVGHLSLDYSTNTMQIDGTASSQHSVNVLIDTLKYTTFKMGNNDSPRTAFTSVVESSFGLSPAGANYSLTVKFDPLLFSNAILNSQGHVAEPKLTVPKQTTTRSAINDPGNTLFNGQNSKGTGQ